MSYERAKYKLAKLAYDVGMLDSYGSCPVISRWGFPGPNAIKLYSDIIDVTRDLILGRYLDKRDFERYVYRIYNDVEELIRMGKSLYVYPNIDLIESIKRDVEDILNELEYEV